jgi:hypothetical protein
MEKPKSLDDWLDAVTVDSPSQNAQHSRFWDMYVVNSECDDVLGAFFEETDAMAFRLHYINKKLNP